MLLLKSEEVRTITNVHNTEMETNVKIKMF
jgi:hypothetical protein